MNVISTYCNNNTDTLELESMQTEWGPRLNLEYPNLASDAPFVLFKIVTLDELNDDGTINPAYIPNDEGILVEQGLNRDSLSIKKDSVANTIEITPQNRIKENEIQLYPNPASQEVTIQLPDNENNYRLNILNNSSQLVLSSIPLKELTNEIDISKLSKGIYQVVITSRNGVTHFKLVVE